MGSSAGFNAMKMYNAALKLHEMFDYSVAVLRGLPRDPNETKQNGNKSKLEIFNAFRNSDIQILICCAVDCCGMNLDEKVSLIITNDEQDSNDDPTLSAICKNGSIVSLLPGYGVNSTREEQLQLFQERNVAIHETTKCLTDLWALPDSDRDKGVKLLNKIFSNILNNPNDLKFRDLNFSKIRAKLDKCRPAFYLLFVAGFNQSSDDSRLQWQNTKITMPLLIAAYNGLQAKLRGEDVSESHEYGAIVDPEQTQLITDREMNLKRAKKAKKMEAKQLQSDIDKITKMEENESKQNDKNENEVDDDEEMKKAMKMSMTEDENADTSNNKQSEDGSGDVDMSDATNPNKSDVREQLKDAGLN